MNISKIRDDFPILGRKINGKKLIYLDNAATTQKPYEVINSISEYYSVHNANIHRGIHTLSQEATLLYEKSREKIAAFIGATKEEIVFVRNATEAINLVARAWGEKKLSRGDEIIISASEHHSNIVPWLMLSKRKKAKLYVAPLSDDFTVDENKLLSLVSSRTKIISVVHVSNVLGTINDPAKIIRGLKGRGIATLLDATQSLPRMGLKANETGFDFIVGTGHKMAGPTGIGFLYAKKEILEEIDPFLGGGDMIREVHFDSFTANLLPYKFEAGTPNIAGAVGFGKAIEYLERIGMDNIEKHEISLTDYAMGKLKGIKGITIYGPSKGKRIGVVSFNIKGIHPHDLAEFLNSRGIAVRSGNHCAMPLHKEILKTDASARISFYVYNTEEEIDICADSINDAIKFFRQ